MTTYTRSLLTDFNNSINIEQLHYEINDNAIIVSVLEGITRVDDDINIVFTTSLSAPEVSELNAVILAHTPHQIFNYSKRIVIAPKSTSIKNNNYTRVAAFYYGGTRTEGVIKLITVESFMESNATDYSIRIIDHNNNTVIVENTFTNTNEMAVELTPISNLPLSSTKIEIHVKITKGSGNSRLYLENINIYI